MHPLQLHQMEVKTVRGIACVQKAQLESRVLFVGFSSVPILQSFYYILGRTQTYNLQHIPKESLKLTSLKRTVPDSSTSDDTLLQSYHVYESIDKHPNYEAQSFDNHIYMEDDTPSVSEPNIRPLAVKSSEQRPRQLEQQQEQPIPKAPAIAVTHDPLLDKKPTDARLSSTSYSMTV